jgi:hypothetical protein
MSLKKPDVMKDSDLRAIREIIGGTTIDLSYLLGTSLVNYKMSSVKGGDRAIPDPRMALLVRFIKKYPNPIYFPMPEMPDYDEFAKLMEMYWMPDLLSDWHRQHGSSAGVHGPLLGVNSSAAYNWSRGGNYDAIIGRLFWIISNLLKKEGKAGMEKWLNVVDEEARSRGKDLKQIVKERSWGRKDRSSRKRVLPVE